MHAETTATPSPPWLRWKRQGSLTSAVLHEDFHYRPSTSRNPIARTFHALAFTFVDKSDSGHNQIAVSNFAGAGARGFAGNFYLPPGYNNLSHAETRTAFAFGTFAVVRYPDT
jgi:hypothetical protein